MTKSPIASFVLVLAMLGSWAGPPAGAQQGAAAAESQAAPSTMDDMMPPFDPAYLIGQWDIEWTPPDTGLFPSDGYTGVETVSHIDSRFFQIRTELDGEDGTRLTADGMMFYEFTLGGQHLVRYMAYSNGVTILQHGNLGGDLGGFYSYFWETPEFEHDDETFVLTGRNSYTSPRNYRIEHRITVGDNPPLNFGTIWLTKRADP